MKGEKNMKKSDGGINSVLTTFSSSFFAAVLSSNTVRLMKQHKSNRGFFSSLLGLFERKTSVKPRRVISEVAEKSTLIGRIGQLVESLFNAPIKSVGITYFVAGAYILAASLVRRYLRNVTVDIDLAICGAICVCVSGIVISSSRSLKSAIGKSKVASVLSEKIFGYVPEPDERTHSVSGAAVSSLIGIALGALSFLSGFGFAMFVIPSLVVGLYVMRKPESGFNLLTVLLIFVPDTFLPYLATVAVLAVFFKVIRGKRFFKPGLSGFLLIVFIAFVIISGTCECFGASFRLSVVLLLILGAPTVFENVESLKNGVWTLMFSASILSAVTAVIKILGLFGGNEIAVFATESLNSVVAFGMGSSAVIAVLAAPPTAALARWAKGDRKLGLWIMFALFVADTAFSGNWELFLCAIVGSVAALMLTSRESLIFIIPIAVCFAVTVLLFGGEIVPFTELSFSKPDNIANSVSAARLLLGGGFDVSFYRWFYPEVSTLSVGILSVGLVGVFVACAGFAVMFLNSIKSLALTDTSSQSRLYICGLSSGAAALVISAISMDVTRDFAVLCFLSVYLGLLVAAQRIADRSIENMMTDNEF